MPSSLDGSTQCGDCAASTGSTTGRFSLHRSTGSFGLEGATDVDSQTSDEGIDASESDQETDTEDLPLTPEYLASGLPRVFDEAEETAADTLLSFVKCAIGSCGTSEEEEKLGAGLDKAEEMLDQRVQLLVGAYTSTRWKLCTGTRERTRLDSLVKAEDICRRASGWLDGITDLDLFDLSTMIRDSEREGTFEYKPSQVCLTDQIYGRIGHLFSAEVLLDSGLPRGDWEQQYRALVKESFLMSQTNVAFVARYSERAAESTPEK